MLYPAELRGPAPTNRGLALANQLTWPGGTTGKGSGATGTPSSASDFACASVAWPWTCSGSASPACIARAVSANWSPTQRESLSISAWAAANQRLLERWTADMIGIERAPGESEAVAPGVTEALHFISTAIEESAQ